MERRHRDSYKRSTCFQLQSDWVILVMNNGTNIEKDIGRYCKWNNSLDFLQQELNWRHTTKQLHTSGYFLSSLKPVDLCTVLYHQGAHKPSIGFGPASQLASLKFELSLPMCMHKNCCGRTVSIHTKL